MTDDLLADRLDILAELDAIEAELVRFEHGSGRTAECDDAWCRLLVARMAVLEQLSWLDPAIPPVSLH